jgi:hypothetical protein
MKGLTGMFSAAALLAAALVAAPAQAAFVGQYGGIDCGDSETTGKFGSGMDCVIPEEFINEHHVKGIKAPAPLIAKFVFGAGSGGFVVGSAFEGLIKADDFGFSLVDASGSSGTWSYSPSYGQPLVSGFVVQEAARFALYTSESGMEGAWTGVEGLMHVSFYDRGLYTTMSQVPAPTPLALLAAGAGLLLFARQRNRGVEGQRSLCAPV